MAGIYLDTSAIGRVLLAEPDARAIREVLAEHDAWWSSELLVVELRRFAVREDLADAAEKLLDAVRLAGVNSATLQRASLLEPWEMAEDTTPSVLDLALLHRICFRGRGSRGRRARPLLGVASPGERSSAAGGIITRPGRDIPRVLDYLAVVEDEHRNEALPGHSPDLLATVGDVGLRRPPVGLHHLGRVAGLLQRVVCDLARVAAGAPSAITSGPGDWKRSPADVELHGLEF